jgi:hypothetical protein
VTLISGCAPHLKDPEWLAAARKLLEDPSLTQLEPGQRGTLISWCAPHLKDPEWLTAVLPWIKLLEPGNFVTFVVELTANEDELKFWEDLAGHLQTRKFTKRLLYVVASAVKTAGKSRPAMFAEPQKLYEVLRLVGEETKSHGLRREIIRRYTPAAAAAAAAATSSSSSSN